MAEADIQRSKESSVDEAFARMLPPAGYEECLVVRVGSHHVWKHPDDLTDDDQVSFFDGDCRDVLLPSDPRVQD